MGNSINASSQRKTVEKEQPRKQKDEQQKGERESEGEVGFGKKRSRIKIVLTKKELELLMKQLKDGGKSLEEVLEEIERGRRAISGWRPSLESIKESPEALEIDRRISNQTLYSSLTSSPL